MLLNPLSTAEIQCFINENIDKSISKLALQKNPFPEVEWISILNQIEAKTKAKDKLPSWFLTKKNHLPKQIINRTNFLRKNSFLQS